MLNKKIISAFIMTAFISGCGSSLPDCGSSEAKDTLLRIVKEKVTGKEDGKLYIEPKFDIINTESKTAEKIQCTAQVTFSIPAIYQVDTTKKISIAYSIAKNEAKSGTFSVTTLADFNDVKDFNSDGWTANQNYLFKKAGVEYLSDSYNDEIAKKLEGNPLALLAMPAMIDAISYKKVNQKLIDAGWTLKGESKDNKMTFIYTKDKFILSIATANDVSMAMLGAQGPVVENADIWEE